MKEKVLWKNSLHREKAALVLLKLKTRLFLLKTLCLVLKQEDETERCYLYNINADTCINVLLLTKLVHLLYLLLLVDLRREG